MLSASALVCITGLISILNSLELRRYIIFTRDGNASCVPMETLVKENMALKTEIAVLKTSLECSRRRVAGASGGEFKMMKPHDVRFTHGSISFCFRNGQSIDYTIQQIIGKQISVEELPPIEVVHHDGSWYSLSNRRLFVLRVLASKHLLDLIPVTAHSFNNHRVQSRKEGKTKWERSFSTPNDGVSVTAGRCGVCGKRHQSIFEDLLSFLWQANTNKKKKKKKKCMQRRC